MKNKTVKLFEGLKKKKGWKINDVRAW